MDTRFLELAARCLEVSVANSTRESPRLKKGDRLSTKGKNDNELEAERRSLLWSIIACLSLERDHTRAQPEEPTKIVSDLGQLASVDTARAKLPHGIACGIKRLESEVARLRSKNAERNEGCKTTECETVLLGNQDETKIHEIKGTKEKVNNTKQVADGEENNAEEAVEVKQPYLASQVKTKKESEGTPTTTHAQKRLYDNLCAKLEIEQRGAPHVRDTSANANNTVAATLTGLADRRAEVQFIMAELDSFRGI